MKTLIKQTNLAILTVLILLSTYRIHADQNDPRLNVLFDDLQQATNPAIASGTEQEIWRIWHTSPNDAALETMQQARQSLDSGDMKAALGHLNKLVQHEPEYAEAWNQRAIVSYLAEDFDGCLRDVDRAISLEPRHFGALSGKGQCYLRLEEPALALDAFEAALDIHPWLMHVRHQIDMLRAYVNSIENKPI